MRHCFEISQLTFFYPNQDVPALQGIDLTVACGQFIALIGPSGSGKSTLLRQLKSALAPHGQRTGDILFEGNPLEQVDERQQSAGIGFVQQSPDNQIVTDTVWHELAFGLESLGFDTPTIRKRVAEMASFFGIEPWFYKRIEELSGGQKQLLNLASIMAMHPSALILDEPTSQLDPIAASEFLTMVGRINRELGTTVLMSEHRLEEVLPMADRVWAIDEGRIIADGTPEDVGQRLGNCKHAMFVAMPTPMRVWAGTASRERIPITVRDGREWLSRFADTHPLKSVPAIERPELQDEVTIEFKDAWFRYEPDSPDILKGLSFNIRKGEVVAVLGGNGTGKTTALLLASGLRKPQRGSVRTTGRLGILPQNPQTLFLKKTVREDLYDAVQSRSSGPEQRDRLVEDVVQLCDLSALLDRHPYDISGGEQQRVALAKVLLLDPDVLLLDEPTKGLDAAFKQTFSGIIKRLAERNVSVLLVSHDVEFCAEHTDRCALFFDGGIITEGSPEAFFTGNAFYTTAANRMARHLLPEAVTAKDVIVACGGTPFGMSGYPTPDSGTAMAGQVGQSDIDEGESRIPAPISQSGQEVPATLPRWRKYLAACSGLGILWAFFRAIRTLDLSQILAAEGVTDLSQGDATTYIVLIASLFVFALSIGQKGRQAPELVQVPKDQRALPARTKAAALMILLLIPLTIFAGAYYLDGKRYYAIALLILFETMLPFFLIFEGRKPKTRELVLIAVLCALGVAARAALFMLPNFKPVLALVILAGVAFGGETGFLVGALTMLASNILFGQGPWTPWQMFAMGIVGFLAGVLFQKGLLRRTKVSLCTFGAISAIVIYGGIMNPASALLWTRTLKPGILLAYYISGLPVDLIHAAATVLILWFAAEPMLEKLDRVKTKYGLISRELLIPKTQFSVYCK